MQLGHYATITHVSHSQENSNWGDVIPVDLSNEQNPFTHFINPDTSIVRCELHFKDANDVVEFYDAASKSGWLKSTAMGIHLMSNSLIYDYINHNIAITLFYSLLTSGIAIVLMLFLLPRVGNKR